jgi:hypothetical protein
MTKNGQVYQENIGECLDDLDDATEGSVTGMMERSYGTQDSEYQHDRRTEDVIESSQSKEDLDRGPRIQDAAAGKSAMGVPTFTGTDMGGECVGTQEGDCAIFKRNDLTPCEDITIEEEG